MAGEIIRPDAATLVLENKTYLNAVAMRANEGYLSNRQPIDFGSEVNGVIPALNVANLLKDPELIKKLFIEMRSLHPQMSDEKFTNLFDKVIAKMDTPEMLARIDRVAKEAMSQKPGNWENLDLNVNKVFDEPSYGKFTGYAGFSLSTNLDDLPLSDRVKYEIAVAASNLKKEGYAHFAPDVNLSVYIADNLEDRQQIFNNLPKTFSGPDTGQKFGEVGYTIFGKDENGKPTQALIIPREYLEKNKPQLTEYGRNYELNAQRLTLTTPQGNVNYAEYLRGLRSAEVTDLGNLSPPSPLENSNQALAKSDKDSPSLQY